MVERSQELAPREDKVQIRAVIKDRCGLRSLLPDIGRGTHENIIEQEEASLFCFDDFTALIVDGLHHVIWADQVAAAITQKLRDRDYKSRVILCQLTMGVWIADLSFCWGTELTITSLERECRP